MQADFSGKYNWTHVLRAVLLISRPKGWRLALQYGLPAVFLIALGVLLYTLATDPTATHLARLIQPGMLVLLLGLFSLLPWARQFSVSYRIWRDPRMHRPVNGFIGSEGISFGAGENARMVIWKRYIRWFSTKDLLVALDKDASLTILPRIFFTSDADWQKAQRMLEKRMARKSPG